MKSLGIALALLVLPVVSLAELKVVYPAAESPQDTRFNDLQDILRTALEKTVDLYGPYRMEPSPARMTSLRYSQELAAGRTPNIIWTSTSVERETALRPIRIPLRKGLLSYRLSLIRADRQERISQIENLADLRQLELAQGVGWGDIQIYEANGIRVRTSNYESLFLLVEAGRVDMFPRGIGEIFDEFDARKDELPHLAIERDLMLHYPWPYYFFVHNEDKELAERLETGLRRMIDDGSFDAIFQRYNAESLARAQLAQRRVIELENHLLPPQTPLDDERLWYRPD